jgi:uncharacterized protein (DUF2141 family)
MKQSRTLAKESDRSQMLGSARTILNDDLRAEKGEIVIEVNYFSTQHWKGVREMTEQREQLRP